ncbi:hypothetical protein PENTCL1PPCAC_830, partial [Pristionchus entomophagus]
AQMLRTLFGARSGISLGCRFLSAAAAPAAKPKVDKEALKELRQRTGYSFVNCKKALEQYDRTQLDEAVKWLHELAKKEGWKKAEKLSTRQTSQGLVGVKIDGDVGAVVELSCETDFVARGEPFQQLLVSLANSVAASAKKQQWPVSQRMETKTLVFDELADENGKSLREVLTDSVGRIGENLTVKSIRIYKAPEGVQFFGASHPKHTVSDVSMGRFVSVLAMKRLAPEGTVFPSVRLADQICQHVIGMRSEGLGEPPLPRLAKKEEVKEESKSEEDELNDFFAGQTTTIDDSETTLLRQAFMLNPSQTVHDYLLGHKAEVIDFARIELSA